MNHEELLTKVNQGSQAQICLDWMGPVFQQCEVAIIANLKNAYRTGTYSEVVLASGVASLCTLEDLKSRLGGMIRTGEGAHKDMEKMK